MQDRRQTARNRVHYGGLLTYGARSFTVNCLVRNLSDLGAKVEFEDSAVLPDRMDFAIERKNLSCAAQLIWRDGAVAGLRFCDPNKPAIPIEWARKLRASERAKDELKARLDQLLNES